MLEKTPFWPQKHKDKDFETIIVFLLNDHPKQQENDWIQLFNDLAGVVFL